MDPLFFSSGITALPGELPDFDPLTIEQEPQFFSADLTYAHWHGGPITRAFINALPPEWRDDKKAILDSRVHMLMANWMPCIPGWHLDDIPRTRKDGQPEHANPSYRAEHLLALVGDCSRTEFLIGDIELQDVPDGQLAPGGYCPETSIYGKWHKDIEDILSGRQHEEAYTLFAPERKLIQFNDQSFHRGTPASHAGWRWFVRLTRGSDRKHYNKVRSQTQVYLPTPNVGW